MTGFSGKGTNHARIAALVVILACFCPLFVAPAYGYLDPGTGSYILQLVIGGLLGGLFLVGVLWKRVVASFKRLFSRTKNHDGPGN